MFYDTFARLCKEKGTTPNAVCRAIGLSNSTATYWKKSGKYPKRETLEKISELLGVSVNYLLNRTEEEYTLKEIKETALHLEQKNAPNDEVRSAIIEKVNDMSNEQAKKFLDFLETFSE